ncbi:PREDICTED: N-acetylglucosamine-1-phosphodiester alpha-N-acetylglucosaminidase-like [Priapulus caudatus]|uniref:N-acetylglucosamine-1-phosphodiester alpha-N-acetylglucosaminidase-like n=1 Tax=Priapulus caudatus TaxID=37621 RepID=A0ABM1EHV0_PRICU|nr:PREDICTED: N-acetylglucosamine-1-phosphodiester alpha-N-acetylglucosaminidase-like [Priapulus caudatus]
MAAPSFGLHCIDCKIVIQFVLILVFTGNIAISLKRRKVEQNEKDVLLPYPPGRHGPRHGNRFVRDCQPAQYGALTSEITQCKDRSSETKSPVAIVKQFIVETVWPTRSVQGHVAIVSNPLKTISVLEPAGGGCSGKTVALVTETASQHHCLVALNAGFFNTSSKECLGNVVSRGKLVHDSGGIQNAHFGILKNGSLFFGYLAENVLLEDPEPFQQLVGGVIWLVRNGASYVNASRYIECDEVEETGTMNQFIDAVSARTAIAHDQDGQVMFVHVDGKTYHDRGVNLWEFAQLLIELGAVNAVNLDGGGSATMVVNGSVINYPSDACADKAYSCARHVSTVLCAHEPLCEPSNCSGHGDCVRGICQCVGQWRPPFCDILLCDFNNCSQHGVCAPGGCVCDAGWIGEFCDTACPLGTYGVRCAHACKCQHATYCHPRDGSCICKPGYQGLSCDNVCPPGRYGIGCQLKSYCHHECSCDHVTGVCTNTSGIELVESYARCVSQHSLNAYKHSKELLAEYRIWIISAVILSAVAALSIVMNMTLLCSRVSKQSSSASLTYQMVEDDSEQEETEEE